MSLKSSRLPSLADKLEPSVAEEVLSVPSEVEVEEGKIKASKKSAKKK